MHWAVVEQKVSSLLDFLILTLCAQQQNGDEFRVEGQDWEVLRRVEIERVQEWGHSQQFATFGGELKGKFVGFIANEANLPIKLLVRY